MILRWPCGVNAPQSRGFVPGSHFGIDFAVPVGTAIVAATDGKVIYRANEPAGYGNTLTITDGPGPGQTRYAHLLSFHVVQGELVRAGQQIGFTGGVRGALGAGNSTGPHLHFEYRTTPTTPVDPMPFFSGDDDVLTDADKDLLGRWMQEQATRVIATLIGDQAPGTKGVLAAWEQDTRKLIIAALKQQPMADAAAIAGAVVKLMPTATNVTDPALFAQALLHELGLTKEH